MREHQLAGFFEECNNLLARDAWKSSFSQDAKTSTPEACAPQIRIAADTAVATTIDDSDWLSLHSVECLLQNFEIGSVARFFACGLDPFFLESVFGWPIGFVKNAEDTGKRQSG